MINRVEDYIGKLVNRDDLSGVWRVTDAWLSGVGDQTAAMFRLAKEGDPAADQVVRPAIGCYEYHLH